MNVTIKCNRFEKDPIKKAEKVAREEERFHKVSGIRMMKEGQDESTAPKLGE
jgi:hypothetical protein